MIFDLKEDVKLMCLKSPNGSLTASETFTRMENKLPTLKGRKFYGLFREENGGETYLTCIGLEEGDDPEELEFFRFSVPSGKYDRERLDDWEKKWDGTSIEGLPELFDILMRRNKGNVDGEKFAVEYYRSQKELIAMLPLKE